MEDYFQDLRRPPQVASNAIRSIKRSKHLHVLDESSA